MNGMRWIVGGLVVMVVSDENDEIGDVSGNYIGVNGAKAVSEALKVNNTVHTINLRCK